MKNSLLVGGAGLLLVAALVVVLRSDVPHSASFLQGGRDGSYVSGSYDFLDRRLLECGSYPNGSEQTVTATSRTFINLPKDIYRDADLRIQGNGATAGYISNGGMPGYAIGSEGRPNCWSYYVELNGSGTVAIIAKSYRQEVPDYNIIFIVSPR